MQTQLNTKISRLVTYALLSGAVALSAGCSGDSEETPAAKAMVQQNTMDVKQPGAVDTPKEPLQSAPASTTVKEKAAKTVEKVEEKTEKVVEKVEKKAEEVKESVKETVAAASKPNGQSAYATCIGCHGANAEGGVGPRLNDQTTADIVTKLEQYKAGEQVGPMTGMMAPMATGLSTAEMEAIAEYVVTLN